MSGADKPQDRLSIARSVYRDIPVYSPQRDPCALDLSDNTSMFGVPPAAEKALRNPPSALVTRYPTVFAQELKTALAAYVGVRTERVATGCGSDDVLDSAIRAFSEPGDRLAYSDPTFGMMPIFAQMNGLKAIAVPQQKTGDIDIEGMLSAKARIIYLCSPNNPTGALVSRDAIVRLKEESGALVILDEAYAEFSGVESTDLAEGRLLIVRALSKAFGLAGLRIGYALGSPEVVLDVEKSRGPYKINALAERAALAALGEDVPWMREKVRLVKESRERFISALSAMGFAPLPSEANFVLLPVADAAAVNRKLRERGIAVRPFPKLRDVGDAVRISIGSWEMMQKVVEGLKEVLR